jgi:hypothetical protein
MFSGPGRASPEMTAFPKSGLRRTAWRNMLVAGINAGIEQEVFGLQPGDNRWPGAGEKPRSRFERGDVAVYAFSFSGEVPARALVRDIGWDELSVHVALWPDKPPRDGTAWLEHGDGGWYAGDAYATGWLERREGAWLMWPGGRPQLRCRARLLDMLVAAKVEPLGFADRGRFIF